MKVDIYTSHVGYLPDAQKTAVVDPEHSNYDWFRIYDCARLTPVSDPMPLRHVQSDWGHFGLANFSEFDTPGMYQVMLGDYEVRSVPFVIAEDVYVKTLRLAFQWLQNQRCGTAVPGFHGPCHLDDAILREGGRHVDTTGGWHDAGDLRKFPISSSPVVMGLLHAQDWLAPNWRAPEADWPALLDEARWQTDWFLKMQDPETGRIWFDSGGGLRNDNSDNHWTDNEIGTGDDRFVNDRFDIRVQWDWTAAMAHSARAFADRDPQYSERCRQAARRCLDAQEEEPSGQYTIDSRAVRTYVRMYELTGDERYLELAHRFADSVLKCQCAEFAHEQNEVRGFFYADTSCERIFKGHGYTAVGLVALAQLALADPGATAPYRTALELYVHDYAQPMTARTPFGIMPYGLYTVPPVDNAVARPLAGELTYRYFKWDEGSSRAQAIHERETFEHGATAHLLNQAVGLLWIDRALGGSKACRRLALKQLEWVMGANPLGMCLMTGGGVNSPYPHSRFVALSPGGIMNGFSGRHADLPWVHNEAHQEHWETNEYWLPHNGNYIRAISLLYRDTDVLL